jgi:hypothetical protein
MLPVSLPIFVSRGIPSLPMLPFPECAGELGMQVAVLAIASRHRREMAENAKAPVHNNLQPKCKNQELMLTGIDNRILKLDMEGAVEA